MTTDWKIEKLECKVSENGLSNVVYKIQWIYKVTNTIDTKQYSSANRGNSYLPTPSPLSFISYDNLTKQQVVDWVTDVLGEENLQTMTTELTNANILKANPVTVILNPPFNN